MGKQQRETGKKERENKERGKGKQGKRRGKIGKEERENGERGT